MPLSHQDEPPSPPKSTSNNTASVLAILSGINRQLARHPERADLLDVFVARVRVVG
jgi:hypothetical protein